ncbi:hypothetical protein KSF_098760 [Reticulibacter mediterranei]|uniref:Uncharacterized protein n=1 Tax=Reticulibacter mediterranei TaxID=2778369 RepID=A0A8J3ISU5_9CHLR|nr:hypothetical protein [Reticulibacter mediterranei]GHO99828.1 hypothetical protein KSF_098760 [Reticulibacter mediterranei]
MKQKDVEIVLAELKQFSNAQFEIDTTYVRPDGNGYQVQVRWAGRVAKVRTLAQWITLKQAWHTLNER